MRKRIFLITAAALLAVTLTACGENSQPVSAGAVAPVAGEQEGETLEAPGEEMEEAAEEETEAEEEKTYAQEHGFQYSNGFAITGQGVRAREEDETDFETIPADWEIVNLTMGEPDAGMQEIKIEQEVSGYIRGDGVNFYTNISLPGGRYADAYTGMIIPAACMKENAESGYRTKVEWDGREYEIGYEENAEWKDGEWEDNPDGEGKILLCTLSIMDIFTVTEGYDGLIMYVNPLTEPPTVEQEEMSGEVRETEKLLADVVSDDTYLINVTQAAEKFAKQDMENEDGQEEESGDREAPDGPEKKEPEADGKGSGKEDAKPAHTHSYTSSMTKTPSCAENGVKTYQCSCGYSYTESIPATGHQWVDQTQVVHHESIGGMRDIIGKKKTFICPCGYRTESVDDFNRHSRENQKAYVDSLTEEDRENFRNGKDVPRLPCQTYVIETTEGIIGQEWVEIQPAWDETVVVGSVCSVCGAVK